MLLSIAEDIKKTFIKKGIKKVLKNMANYKNNQKRKFKMSNKTKSILVTVGMILLIFGVLAGVYTIMNNKPVEEGYESYKVTWKSGGINLENGAMEENKNFMFSSKIDVDTGLLIRRDYASNVSYMVFYYNNLGELVYADLKPENKETNGYTSDYVKSIDEIPVEEGVVIDHARIVCEWLQNDDDKLSIFERKKLSNKLDVYIAVETFENETEE